MMLLKAVRAGSSTPTAHAADPRGCNASTCSQHDGMIAAYRGDNHNAPRNKTSPMRSSPFKNSSALSSMAWSRSARFQEKPPASKKTSYPRWLACSMRFTPSPSSAVSKRKSTPKRCARSFIKCLRSAKRVSSWPFRRQFNNALFGHG